MGQVETKTILIGGTPDGLSGQMHELTDRTYLNQDKTKASADGGFWLLGNPGDQIPVEDAVRYGLLDGDAVKAPELNLDARTIAVDEIQRRSADLDRREAQLEARQLQFSKDRAAAAAIENTFGLPVSDPQATEDVSAATGDTESTEEAPASSDGTDGSEKAAEDAGVKEAAKTADKAVEKPKTK